MANPQTVSKQKQTGEERPLSELYKILREKYQFENPEIFTTKKQALEVIKELGKKVAVASTKDADSKEDDKKRHMTKALRMKEHLDAQPKVRMLIPLTGKEKKGLAFETVIMNGYRTDWPKGEYIEVPQQIADLLADALLQTSEAGKEFRMDRSPDVERALSR